MRFSLAVIPLIAGMALACTTGTWSQAALIEETFTYDDGVVDGQNGGTGWGGAWGATSSVNDPPNEFEIVGGQALFMGNSDAQLAGGNQEIITHSRAFDATYTIDANMSLTVSFDLIANETQLGRGIGINLTDSTNGQQVFIGKQINQSGSANGVHSSIATGGDDYLALSTGGTASLTATFTSNGIDTLIALTNGSETVNGTIPGVQFAFDGLDLAGYHRQTRTNGVDNIRIEVTAVPEPSTCSLLVLAGLGMAGCVRRGLGLYVR